MDIYTHTQNKERKVQGFFSITKVQGFFSITVSFVLMSLTFFFFVCPLPLPPPLPFPLPHRAVPGRSWKGGGWGGGWRGGSEGTGAFFILVSVVALAAAGFLW